MVRELEFKSEDPGFDPQGKRAVTVQRYPAFFFMYFSICLALEKKNQTLSFLNNLLYIFIIKKNNMLFKVSSQYSDTFCCEVH